MMNTTIRLKAARLATFAVLAIALISTAYTYRSYYVVSELLADSVEALAPIDSKRVTEYIEAHLPSSANTTRVRALIRAEQESAELVHEGWLNTVRLQSEILRDQLVLWLIVLGAALVAMLALHRQPPVEKE